METLKSLTASVVVIRAYWNVGISIITMPKEKGSKPLGLPVP